MDRLTESTSEETAVIPRPVTRVPSRLEEDGRFPAGTMLGGRYRIVGLLGRGGMGEVYRATDLTLAQPVALKFLPPEAAGNPFLLERFHGEVRVARQISHVNVCRVYDIGEAEGLPFISMEYVDGEDLASLLTRIGRLPGDKALQTARQICAGLAAAHDKGVIHRDLKPHNIMLNKRGEIVIMDFGLAAIADQLAPGEARNGTPAYMAPEQLKGIGVTAKSDIYALGLVLFELFTGRRPYEGKTIPQLISEQESAHAPGMKTLASDVDPAVEPIVRRCLDPDPAKRPGSALAIAAALPGGDPLAAALAAGHTPSPDLVAASGQAQGMAVRYALICFASILMCVFTAPVLKQMEVAFYRSPTEFPPDVLRAKGREIAAAFGYPRKPADTALALNQRMDLLSYLNARPSPRAWKDWLASESPFSASYRESPTPMVALPDGDLTRENPPLTIPGMVSLELDGAGRLRDFAAVPPGIDEPAAPATREQVFRAAQLDPDRFQEAALRTVPAVPADRTETWTGPHPRIPNLKLTVEISWWKGRITQVRFGWPWTHDSAASELNPFFRDARAAILPVLVVIGLAFAILLARRNWKAGRVDWRGAFALALTQLTLNFSVWATSSHAVADGQMFNLAVAAASEAVFAALSIMLIYIALEPALRARWPHSIITWNRVLAGRWHDPQVGSHVLLGAALGTLLWNLNEARMAFGGWHDDLSTVGGLYLLTGSREWIAGILSRGLEALTMGLVIFFMIFGLRQILRREWIAALAGALIFSLLQPDMMNSLHWQTEFCVYVVLYAALIFALLRFGLMTTIAAVFFLNTLNGATLGTDWTTWYTPTGFATSLVILALATVALRISLTGRDLFPERAQTV